MPWSKQQIIASHVAMQQLKWADAHYRMILQNVAGIRPFAGKVSSKNPTADNAGFERFMAFAEAQGFVDTHHGPGYWAAKAQDQRQRIHYKILELADRARRHHLFTSADALAGYVERMTQHRAPEVGGPTRKIEECDAVDSYKILEGLKKWVYRLAREQNITLLA